MREGVYVSITDHGRKRFKQRTGLPKRLAAQKAAEAITHGITEEDTTGKLRQYLFLLSQNDGRADRVVVYNQIVYLFRGRILVTVLRLPGVYRLSAERAQKRKQAKNKVGGSF